MLNFRYLKISLMFAASISLVATLPAKSQQVILTPAGTMPQIVQINGILGNQPLTEQPDGMELLGIDPNSSKVTVNNDPNPVTSQPGPVQGLPSVRISTIEEPGNVYDAQGKLVYTKEQVVEILRLEAEKAARNPGYYATRLGSASSSTDTAPLVNAPLASESLQAVTPLANAPSIKAMVNPTLTQSPVASVAIQASQNPSADFATTRSAPRNTVPEQLNQGVINSPLSNSRIFPGMR
jgi:hypothetical protein